MQVWISVYESGHLLTAPLDVETMVIDNEPGIFIVISVRIEEL